MARILVLSPYEPPSDGIARHTANLVEAWDSAGHSVLVISSGKHHGLQSAESIGSHSKVARLLGQWPRRRTWNAVVQFHPDMVFVQFAIAAMSVNIWSVRSLCKRCIAAKIPVVVAYHEPAREYGLLGVVTRSIYRSMARVTQVPVVFSSAGRQALTDSGLFNSAIEVSLGTTGLAAISEADIERVRDLYGIRKPLVLSLGFVGSDKGTDVLLNAAGAVAATLGNDVQFLIAGSPRKRRGIFRLRGYFEVRLQRRLELLGKSVAGVEIAFSGFVADQDVAALLFMADVVVLSYRRTTQSAVANLALSSRSVIVASNLPGLRSDLGDVARYFEVGNAGALAEQIASLMGAENASAREVMRNLSGERALATTFANVAEMILSVGLATETST